MADAKIIGLKLETYFDTVPNLLAGENFSKKLSENRARSVATYLTDNGIAPERITYKGYGKSMPKVSGTSKDANRQNQRVELKVMAK